jgi:hypothetical protein
MGAAACRAERRRFAPEVTGGARARPVIEREDQDRCGAPGEAAGAQVQDAPVGPQPRCGAVLTGSRRLWSPGWSWLSWPPRRCWWRWRVTGPGPRACGSSARNWPAGRCRLPYRAARPRSGMVAAGSHRVGAGPLDSAGRAAADGLDSGQPGSLARQHADLGQPLRLAYRTAFAAPSAASADDAGRGADVRAGTHVLPGRRRRADPARPALHG